MPQFKTLIYAKQICSSFFLFFFCSTTLIKTKGFIFFFVYLLAIFGWKVKDQMQLQYYRQLQH